MTQEELTNVFKYIVKKCDILINNDAYKADTYTQDTVENIAELCNHILDGDYGKLDEVKEVQEETVSEDLEEVSKKCSSCIYLEEVLSDDDKEVLKERLINTFKAGAKWQKEQIMKDAIECKVDWYDGFLLDYAQEQQDYVLEKIGAKVGDKVKVIIIKSE